MSNLRDETEKAAERYADEQYGQYEDQWLDCLKDYKFAALNGPPLLCALEVLKDFANVDDNEFLSGKGAAEWIRFHAETALLEIEAARGSGEKVNR